MKARRRGSQLTAHRLPLTTSRGFTLVEVLFALFFLTIGVFGVYSLIINNQRILEANKNFASALMLGEQGLVMGEISDNLEKNYGSADSKLLISATTLNDSGQTPGANEQSFVRAIHQCGTAVYSVITWTDTLGEHKKVFSRLLIINNQQHACDPTVAF